MDCPDCGGRTIPFGVPERLRAYAPGDPAALCSRCLRVHAFEGDDPGRAPGFDTVAPGFPTGEAGPAFALLCGKMDSLALEREAVTALVEETERAGGDAYLALERLSAAENVEAHFDVERRRTQLRQFVG